MHAHDMCTHLAASRRMLSCLFSRSPVPLPHAALAPCAARHARRSSRPIPATAAVVAVAAARVEWWPCYSRHLRTTHTFTHAALLLPAIMTGLMQCGSTESRVRRAVTARDQGRTII